MLDFPGYEDTSALGLMGAMDQDKRGGFELLMLGHSIPYADEKEMLCRMSGILDAPAALFGTPTAPIWRI